MKQIKLTDLVDSVIDCLTEPDGGHAVGNGDIKDAVLELKEIKALFIHVVVNQRELLLKEQSDWLMIHTSLEVENIISFREEFKQ